MFSMAAKVVLNSMCAIVDGSVSDDVPTAEEVAIAVRTLERCARNTAVVMAKEYRLLRVAVEKYQDEIQKQKYGGLSREQYADKRARRMDHHTRQRRLKQLDRYNLRCSSWASCRCHPDRAYTFPQTANQYRPVAFRAIAATSDAGGCWGC